MYQIDWWEKFREKTFDKLADKYGVTMPYEEGIDFYYQGGSQLFPWNEETHKRGKLRRDHLKESKTKRPIRYFLFYTLAEWIENTLEFIPRKYSDIKYWIKYRTFDKYHVVDTKLKPNYYDADYILEKAIVSILVDFVEVEAAWASCRFDDRKKDFKRDRYFGQLRNRELGKEYFDFHINHEDNDAETIESYTALWDAYIFFKDRLPKHEKLLKDMNDEFDFDNMSNDALSDHVKNESKLENDINELKKRYLIDIIKHKHILWT